MNDLNRARLLEERIVSIALQLLGNPTAVTREQLDGAISRAKELFSNDPDLVHFDQRSVVRRLEVKMNVRLEDGGGALGDNEGHIDWLGDRAPGIAWNFWNRYRHWLQFITAMPPAVVDNLDTTTRDVLGRLEDPKRPGSWDRRGMVVGHVQSGKTAHYTGLICKAADAGYRLIVVLAGIDNGLRAQTQLRLDQGFLGFTMGYGLGAQAGARDGVGLLPQFEGCHALSLTVANENGDFRKGVAQGLGCVPGGPQPIILVVKKNQTVLRNLLEWATAVLGSEQDGVHRIPSVPLLVIDDECDHASVNTKNTIYDFAKQGSPSEPTKINGLIRRLLTVFDQSAYVGYTATPFANIFIYHQEGAERKEFGEDIFPRSFIYCLARSSDYMGADRVFGLRASEVESDDISALPILRPFEDLETYISPQHKASWIPPPGPVPSSLKSALLSFVLACAARRARGDSNQHNSMLVHLSRFVDVQMEIFKVIEREMNQIKLAISNSSPNDRRPVWNDLQTLWNEDFLPTSREIADPDLGEFSWEELSVHIHPAAEKIQVRVINGTSEDALNYYNNRERGLSVIAIGGNKLSRGLTLEGLSVSYFQRSSKMYDTLMQMGRWFGYRRGYLDLCRLYTTQEMIGWYGHIAYATEELYQQFEEMRIIGATPKQFGLRVAKSPENLLITARVKMRHATTVKLSYSATNPSFRTILKKNIDGSIRAVEELLEWCKTQSPPTPVMEGAVRVFGDLPPTGIQSFLRAHPSVDGIASAHPQHISQYIEVCNRFDELTKWTVAFISLRDQEAASITIGGIDLKLVRRKARRIENGYQVGTLWDPDHEALGLSDEDRERAKNQVEEALLLLGVDPPSKRANPLGLAFRSKRPPSHGLLAIYFLDPTGFHGKLARVRPAGFEDVEFVPAFAFSFPASERAPGLDYAVRNDFWDKDDDDLEEEL